MYITQSGDCCIAVKVELELGQLETSELDSDEVGVPLTEVLYQADG